MSFGDQLRRSTTHLRLHAGQQAGRGWGCVEMPAGTPYNPRLVSDDLISLNAFKWQWTMIG